MSLKAEVLSPDLQKQLELLEQFPDIVDQEYRPAMEHATGVIEARIAPNIPSARAKAEFGSKVEGKGLGITGVVGFFGSFWQINILEYGAAAHQIPKINPRRPIKLPDGWVMGPIRHPGFGARGFMKAGFSVSQQVVESVFGVANERIAKHLSVSGWGE